MTDGPNRFLLGYTWDPDTEPRTIDFRTPTWGHAFHLDLTPNQPGYLSGLVHCTPGPEVGDRVMWATAYGYAVGEVTERGYVRDPPDMHRITVRTVERHGVIGTAALEVAKRRGGKVPTEADREEARTTMLAEGITVEDQ